MLSSRVTLLSASAAKGSRPPSTPTEMARRRLMFLTKGKFSHIIAIVKEHWHFFAGMGRYWKKRKANQKLITALAFEKKLTTNSKGIYNKSIVFQHFVRKIYKFSDLKTEVKN